MLIYVNLQAFTLSCMFTVLYVCACLNMTENGEEVMLTSSGRFCPTSQTVDLFHFLSFINKRTKKEIHKIQYIIYYL